MTHTPRATLDFETRSECSLKMCGSWRYSLDATTEPLCLAFRLPSWAPGRTGIWTPAFPHLGLPAYADADLAELFAWIAAGGLVEAHNAWFERGIWTNIMVPRFGWPSVDVSQWRCSAAKAAAAALPRGLDDALAALKLPIRKDAEGSAIMKKMVKPRKPIQKDWAAWLLLHGDCPTCHGTRKTKVGRAKAQPCATCEGKGFLTPPPPLPTLYHETADQMAALFAYCQQDVLAEEALSHALPDLCDTETVYYLIDQIINQRGFQLDAEAVEIALGLIEQEVGVLNAELAVITDGAVRKATNRVKMLDWLAGQGVYLEDTQGATVDEALAQMALTEPTRRALEVLRTLGRSSTAKYQAMRYWMSPADARARGGLLFHGATTGRWSGSGIQPHNFPKGTLKKVDMMSLWEDILTGERETLIAKYGGVMEALSHGLRGAIVATPGCQLYVADYASIEARVLLWLAGDEKHLEMFRNGADMYVVMAERIYGYPVNKNDHPMERGIGKFAVLGLGYQMGVSKFVDTCAKGGAIVSEDFGRTAVAAYREEFYPVKQLWWDMEDAAIQACDGRGEVFRCGPTEWWREGHFLYCELPSGRRLAYPFPEVRPRETPWGDMKPSLTYMGVDAHTHQWKRQTVYGGLLVENVTQAVARDVMADAMLRCEMSGVYAPVLTVHDELIAEAPLGVGSVEEFERLVGSCPEWATGCPIAAEGWRGLRYHK